MTNKERLEANNAKIEQILQNLDGKIVAVVDKSVNVAMPQGMVGSNTPIYTFSTRNKGALISFTSPNGLYKYSSSTKELLQIYSSGTKWDLFVETNKGCLISSSWSAGLLYYSYKNETLEVLYSTKTWTKIVPLKNGFLITSAYNQEVLFFNSELEELSIIQEANTGIPYISSAFEVNDDVYLLSCGSSSYKGIYKYTISLGTIEQINDIGYNYVASARTNNKLIIGGDYGLIVYDVNTGETTNVWTETRDLKYIKAFDKYCLIGSSVSNSGLLLYSEETNETTKILTKGDVWKFIDIPSGCLVTTSGTVLGVGLRRFDKNTGELIDVYDVNGRGWSYFVEFEDFIVMSSGVIDGILIFEKETNTATLKFNTDSSWRFVHNINNNKFLITNSGSSGSRGVVLYDRELNKITKKYSYGYGYDIFTPTENGNYYLEQSAKVAGIPSKLLYDAQTDTITALELYLGEI